MKLVSFSVENFRSITKARKITLTNYSLLVGANNEGKSNILHALTLAMNALVAWHRQLRRTSTGSLRRVSPALSNFRHGRLGFNWHTDYPVTKQNKASPTDATNITLEFELSDEEVNEFSNEIGSQLNGTLPLQVSFRQRSVEVSVRKQGRGGVTLTKKSTRIANFVSRRIRFEYIPAIRTAESASRVIEQLVESELFRLEGNPEYAKAVREISELQQPVFKQLAETIQDTVTNFLPNVKSVRLSKRRDARYRALGGVVEIEVDDGHMTRLERKGDGVQSLVALAMMRHASEQSSPEVSTVFAIEEPESHLHPRAVHELRAVIRSLATKNQIVLTSHSPLFVNPEALHGTIIVKSSRATPAKNIAEVRNALGVRFADNLQSARLVMLVEGTDDALAIRSIVSKKSKSLARALANGTIAIDTLGGASGLRQKASYYQAGACLVQCFLDADQEAITARERAIQDKVITQADVNLSQVPELNESELEDLYDKNVYRDEFQQRFGVDPKNRRRGRTRQKWSKEIEKLFREAGKPWDDRTKAEAKGWLAKFAADHPHKIVHTALSGPLDCFIETAETKLAEG